jgi:hypothetical protein
VVHFTRGYEETSFFWNDVVLYKSTYFYSKNTTPIVFSRQHSSIATRTHPLGCTFGCVACALHSLCMVRAERPQIRCLLVCIYCTSSGSSKYPFGFKISLTFCSKNMFSTVRRCAKISQMDYSTFKQRMTCFSSALCGAM